MHPRLLQFRHLVIPTYGVCVAAGTVCALLLSLPLARRARLPVDSVFNVELAALFGVILGPRLLFLLTHLRIFFAAPLVVFALPIPHGSPFVSVGIALALLLCSMYLSRLQLPPLRTLDTLAPGVAIALAAESVGGFAAGYGFGAPTALPWGVVYSSRLAARFAGVPLGVRLHPTQIYAALAQVGIAALLLGLFTRRHHDGEVAGTWLFLTGLSSFLLQPLRGGITGHMWLGGSINTMQLWDAAAVLAGGALWLRHTRHERERTADVL